MSTLISRTTSLIESLGLVISLAFTTSAVAGSSGATLGPVWTGGTQQAGGTLFYQLNLTATSTGQVTAVGIIKTKGWKAAFPVLLSPSVIGFNLIPSAPIAIPADVSGTAKLKVKVRHNGKSIGSKTVLVSIAPAAAPAAAGSPTVLYDVGFDKLVTLDGFVASTNGMSTNLTFAWTQLAPQPWNTVVISNALSANPTFTTLSLTNFVTLDETPGIVGFDTDQIEMSTYKFQVIVSDDSISSTGNVTVLSGSTSPAQPNVPLGLNAYLRAANVDHPSNNWQLVAKPLGSTATLQNPTSRTPSIRPDKEGDYVIRDRIDNTDFVLSGAKFIGASTCASCHGPEPVANLGLADMYTPWSQTKHATFFQRAIDGQVSDHYNESCIACHTVGNNKTPTAVNDGFDDVAAAAGWTFPNPLQPGNYLSLPAALKNKANIQCESCHGPGSTHPGAASESLDVAACATCHQDGKQHTRVEQWERSAHAEPYLELSHEEGTNPSCARCHSPAGFVDTQRGKPTIRAEAGRLTCQTCHDPHNSKGNEHQVRVSGTVEPYAGVTFNNAGTSATCMSCHNARRTIVYAPGNFSTPHGNPASEVLTGQGGVTRIVLNGVTNSVTLVNSSHRNLAGCVDCHMAPNPADGDPGHDQVGDHTFKMAAIVDEGEVQNVAACNGCHGGEVDEFDYVDPITAGDYDGNGAVEGVQTEVNALLDILKARIQSTGIATVPPPRGTNPFAADAALNAAQRAAIWNWALANNEGSHGVHNTGYTVGLLQWSYTILSTTAGGNSFATDYPQADIRY